MDKTAEYIHADSSEIQYEVCRELHELGGYNIISVPNMFVFAHPDDGKCLPVLLQTNWDTRLASTEEPHLLGWRDTNTKGLALPDKAMFNSLGRLGAGRIGLRLAVETSQMYQEKPFLLFTNFGEDGCLGMLRAIKEKVLEPYLDYIYAVISTNRSGYNYFSTRYWGEDDKLPGVVQSCGYLQKGTKLGDASLLEDVYGIRNVNVACGVFNKNTMNEYLSEFGFYSARENIMLLLPSVKEPYRCPVYRETEEYISLASVMQEDKQPTASSTSTKNLRCVICGKPDRETAWNNTAQAFVCCACTNRAITHGVILTPSIIEEEKVKLRREQSVTRQANRRRDKQRKQLMPICPVCGLSEEVTWNPEKDQYYCIHCQQYFFMGKHKGKPKHIYINKQGRVITSLLNRKDDRVLSNEPLGSNSAIITCPVCGETTSHKARVWILDPYTGKEMQVLCCPDCIDIVKRMNADLLHEEYGAWYTIAV